VAVDGTGAAVVAVTDETEDDADVTVSRLEPDGSLAWTLRFEGGAGLDDAAQDIAIAGDGSIYVAVSEQMRELVSEGFGNQAERNVVVLAIEADGARRWRWEREVPPPMYSDNARQAAVATFADGHVVVLDVDGTSEFVGPPSFVELDRWGNEIVRGELEAILDETRRLEVEIGPSDDVYVAASIFADSWIARLSRNGAIVWETHSEADVLATSIAAGEADEAYVLFANGDAEAGDAGLELRRYDAAGPIAWTFAMPWSSGDGYPAGVIVDCDGSPIVAGEISAVPMRSAWIGAITTEGDLAWSSTLGADRPIAPRSLARGADGTLVVGGLQGSELGPWVARLERP
jgi:outer membrane protein assembly factor BamB